MGEECYESYPRWMVILSNILSISTYIIGAYILYGLGIILTVLYLLFCPAMEIRLLRKGCTSCYYYGKTCAFGKGRLSSYLFKKRDLLCLPTKRSPGTRFYRIFWCFYSLWPAE
ncbi:MAG: hypothetical protein ACC609_03135 [Methanobacterium formicicum]